MTTPERPDARVRVDVLLPAGGRLRGDFAAEAGTEIKALIALGGRTVLERTLAALRAADRVGRVVIIGPREVGEHPAARAADVVLPESGVSGPANVLRGLEWLGATEGGERIMVVTSDLPFLTAAAISGFADACPAAEICVPVIRRQELEARFPGLPAKYMRLRDGEWTIGCAFLVNPAAIIRNRELIERAFAARKQPLAMARLLGPLFVARFLVQRLTIAHIEQRCAELLGLTGAGVRGCAPELAVDIDEPATYRYAARHCRE